MPCVSLHVVGGLQKICVDIREEADCLKQSSVLKAASCNSIIQITFKDPKTKTAIID